MEQQKYNPNIGCNVTQCRYQCTPQGCCSLDQIDVHQEAQNVAATEHNTCCHSFECR